LLELYKGRKVSSWLIRLKKTGSFGDEILATLSVPFVTLKDGEIKVGNIEKVTFQVLYAASSISMRLSNLTCPAFRHRKRIAKIDIMDQPGSLKMIIISPSEEYKPGSKITEFSFGNITFNGGNSLKGKYYLELSMFGSADQFKKSSWVNFDQYVEIASEAEVDLKGCDSENDAISPKQDEGSVQKFKFGR
jgi:hypothetical protein